MTAPAHRTTVPARALHWIERPDLVHRASPPPGTVVSVVAPAGYGKTSVAIDVARGSAVPVAWLSMDRHDSDPSRLWSGLLMSLDLAGVRSPAGAAGPARGAGTEPWWEAAAVLVDALGAADPILLVLDGLDPHDHVGAGPALDYLLEWMPDRHAVLITGRRTWGAAAPGRIAPERLLRIGAVDLRLSDDEAAALLQLLAPELPASERADLVGLTDGWAAAVVLAARNTRAEARSGWGEPHEDALLDRVLPGLIDGPDALLALAAASPVTASLAATYGVEAPRFRDLAHAGLLLPWGDTDADVRRPSGRPESRWRLTRPLAAAGDRRLRATDPGRHASIHRAAGEAAAAAGDAEAAIDHLVAAGDLDGARTVLHQVEDDLFLTGRARDVRQWYRTLYSGPEQQQLESMLRAAWSAVLSYDHSEADRIVMILSDSMSAHSWTSQRVAGEILVLRATLAGRRGQLEHMEEFGRRAVLAFGDDWSTNSRILARVVVARSALWRDDLPALRMAHDELAAQAGLPDYFASGFLPALTAGVALAEGRLRDAIRFAGHSRDWFAEHPGLAAQIPTRDAELTLAAAMSESGLDPEAASVLDEMARFGDEYDQPVLSVLARVHRARSAMLARQHRDAFRALADARAAAIEAGSSPRLRHRIDEIEVPLALQVGDAARARAAALRLPEGSTRTLLMAAVQQLRRPSSGARALERLVPEGPRQEVHRDLLLARSALTSDRRRALVLLSRAAAVAEENGLMLVLRLYPADLVDFAREAGVRTADRALSDLVRFAGFDVEPSAPSSPTAPSPLSAGERQLLALLPTRLTYDGIAADLGVSVNTIKSRIKRLYAKLEVGSRDDAVAAARARGLIA